MDSYRCIYVHVLVGCQRLESNFFDLCTHVISMQELFGSHLMQVCVVTVKGCSILKEDRGGGE